MTAAQKITAERLYDAAHAMLRAREHVTMAGPSVEEVLARMQ